jgi:hypothetical protein
LVVLCAGGGTRKTEIADFEIAVGVEKKVGGFEISVKDIGGVESFEGSESLIDEILAVVVGEFLCANDTVHIRLHQLLNEVDFAEALVVARLLDIED